MKVWVSAETARLANERIRQQLLAGRPGPEGSAAKLTYAAINQEATRLRLELAGDDGLTYDDWSLRAVDQGYSAGRPPGYHYLRARANSIEGGTSEVLRGVIADRILNLPREPRTDNQLPWREIPR
jgi:alkylation response protein AidB-like acyl-CoA dehydrogenase